MATDNDIDDLSFEKDSDLNLDNHNNDSLHDLDLWSNSGVVTINNKSFVAGLYWESFEDKKHQKIAANKAKEYNANLLCFRKISANKHQYGFSSSEKNKSKAGMYSLASTISRNLEEDDSLLAVFNLEGNSYYIVAIKEDFILPGYDLLVADENDALNIFSSIYYDGGFKTVIAPSAWSIDKSTESPITDYIMSLSSKDKLKKTKALNSKIVGITLLFFLLIVGFCFQKHEETVKKNALLAEQAKEYANEAAEIAMKAKLAKPVEEVAPWVGLTKSTSEMDFCVKNILATKLEVPGWKATSLSCQGSNITVSYTKTFGTINWFGPALNSRDLKPVVTATGTSTVSVTWTYNSQLPVYSTDDIINTIPLPKVYKYLESYFDEYFQTINLQLVPEVPTVTHTSHGDVSTPPQYGTMFFTFSTTENPSIFESLFTPLPVLNISDIELDLGQESNLQWTIKGSTYEKLSVQNTPKK
jgi:hypothetical protein